MRKRKHRYRCARMEAAFLLQDTCCRNNAASLPYSLLQTRECIRSRRLCMPVTRISPRIPRTDVTDSLALPLFLSLSP